MRIVLCYPAETRHLDQIQTACPEATVVDAGQEGIAEEIHEADIYFGHAKVPVDWPRVVQQRRLRWIQSSAAGLDHCLVPAVIESDIAVTSASGLFADQVAEQTMAMILGWFRSMPVFHAAQQRREFTRRPTRDLTGKTVGIVGLGGNGRRLAQVLAPWKVRMVATDWFPIQEHRPPEVEQLWPADQLHRLLNESDVVILSVPLNQHTTGMIGSAELAAMRPGSLLVNVARGSVVVEHQLVEALQSGHLAGAALDVTEVEPLPAHSPLWSMPQVIITPHVAAQSARRVDDVTRFFCENLARYQRGQSLMNLVDKRLGFPVPDLRPS